MQLFVAPVPYRALILRPKLLMAKTVPVAGPTAIVQVSTKCLSMLCNLCSSHQVCSALVVSPVSWGWGHPPGSGCQNIGTSPLLLQTPALCSQSLWQLGP